MKNTISWLAAAGLSLALAACVPEFENALDTGEATDPALIGVWDGKSEGDTDPLRIEIAATADGVSLIMRDPTGGSDERIQLKGRTAEVSGVRYLSLTPVDAEALGAGDAKVGYYVFRYAHDGATIKVWALDTKKVADAIEGGRLKGTVTGSGTDTAPKISASSAELAAFFATPEAATIFDEDGPGSVLILKRATP